MYIKELERGAEETRIAQMLSTKELRTDTRNHSVPIIEVIDDPEDDTISYMVMPLLRAADSPSFQFVKEIIDFVDQILEVMGVVGWVFSRADQVSGLGVLARKRSRPSVLCDRHIVAAVADADPRDCVMHNLMMDADAMYPDGFHPVRTRWNRDYTDWATYVPRSAVGVRYYFVDFGISLHIPEHIRPKLATGNLGRDHEPPELSVTVPYDPFKLDVFIIGNMFKHELYDVRPQLTVDP